MRLKDVTIYSRPITELLHPDVIDIIQKKLDESEDPRLIKPTPPKELNNLDLLELVCQLHSRASHSMLKEMHNAYMDARKEMESRITALPINDDEDDRKMNTVLEKERGVVDKVQDILWNEVIAIVATFDIMKNTRPGDAESINYFKKKATDELKSKFQLTKKQ